jgi:hypothetical protein
LSVGPFWDGSFASAGRRTHATTSTTNPTANQPRNSFVRHDTTDLFIVFFLRVEVLRHGRPGRKVQAGRPHHTAAISMPTGDIVAVRLPYYGGDGGDEPGVSSKR